MFCLRAVTLIVVGALSFSCSDNDPTPAFQRAMSLVNSPDREAGVQALDSLLERHPDFDRGWSSLGIVHRASENHDASLEAFLKAAALKPESANLMFQVGVSHALLDQVDPAFEWLFRAKETNAVNVINIAANPAAVNIQDDPRYSDLFPTTAEFADPFVENVRIIHEWSGEQSRDKFGWIARNVGDIDGDGINDLTTSAPTSPEGSPAAGKIYAYSGKSGALLWERTGTAGGGQLGFGIEAAGDVNADGIPDVVASAPYANLVTVYSGADGTDLLTLAGSDSTGGFGSGVKGIGDVNGDGYGDILVGEPFQIFGGPINGGPLNRKGNAYVFSGIDGSVLLTLSGEADGDAFGTAVSGATLGGESLFLIGAPNAGSGGRAYVYRSLSATPAFVAEPGENGASFGGMFMSVVGDVNGDGSRDVYVSDFSDTTQGPATGRAYVFSGVDGTDLRSFTGEQAGDGFGIGIADAGDADQDGYDDLIIGAWQHANEAPSGGKVYLYSGMSGEVIRTITGKIPAETFGFDATGIGDIDGDGAVDFLITSAFSAVRGFQTGRMFVIAGE